MRAILGQPLLAIILFQNRKLFSHLAQVVINRAVVITQLARLCSIAQVQIRVPILIAELLHDFVTTSEMIEAPRRQFLAVQAGTITPRALFISDDELLGVLDV